MVPERIRDLSDVPGHICSDINNGVEVAIAKTCVVITIPIPDDSFDIRIQLRARPTSVEQHWGVTTSQQIINDRSAHEGGTT